MKNKQNLMEPAAVQVKRLPIELKPDSRRVITRFFGFGEESRMRGIIKNKRVTNTKKKER